MLLDTISPVKASRALKITSETESQSNQKRPEISFFKISKLKVHEETTEDGSCQFLDNCQMLCSSDWI